MKMSGKALCGFIFMAYLGAADAQDTCAPDGYSWPSVAVGSASSLIQLNMEVDPNDPDGGVSCESIRVRVASGQTIEETSNAFSWVPPAPSPGSHQLHFRTLFVRPTAELLVNPAPLLMEVYRHDFVSNRNAQSSLAVWVSSSGATNVNIKPRLSLVTTLTTGSRTVEISSVSLGAESNGSCWSGRRLFSACVYIDTSPSGTSISSTGSNGDHNSTFIPQRNVRMIHFGSLAAPIGDTHSVELAHTYFSDSL